VERFHAFEQLTLMHGLEPSELVEKHWPFLSNDQSVGEGETSTLTGAFFISEMPVEPCNDGRCRLGLGGGKVGFKSVKVPFFSACAVVIIFEVNELVAIGSGDVGIAFVELRSHFGIGGVEAPVGGE
jgi:hypothetical protein